MISRNLNLPMYSELASSVSTVLQTYEQIAAPIASTIKENSFEEIRKNVRNNRPTYESISFILLHPSPQIRYLKKWIDASLQLDLGLILSDLILTEAELNQGSICKENNFCSSCLLLTCRTIINSMKIRCDPRRINTSNH